MKSLLMYKDHDYDFNKEEKLSPPVQALVQDLALNTLFEAMAGGDAFLASVAKHALLNGLNNAPATILYRQGILKDCLKNSSIVRDIYAIAVEALESKRKSTWGIFIHNYPSSTLHGSIEVLQILLGILKKLRNIADEHSDKFASEGFKAFFTMLQSDLEDEYFTRIQNHLKELKFRGGVLISAELGQGNKGANYILCKPPHKKKHWLKRLFVKRKTAYTFYIADRDIAGARALSELRDRGINLVANSLAQSMDHILSFFSMLRTELAFYAGCLNLYEQLAQWEEPMSFPLFASAGERQHAFQGLYDVCLALTMGRKVVGNTLNADHKDFVVITGANQGGKSTFLRSIGLAQLMMQCGMFAPAEAFYANVCDSLFTHYKREEDAAMKSGKLDEELSRMSDIVDRLTANSLVLFNESFAATNEREGAEIARQIIRALLGKGIKVFFVTHAYEFARGFYEEGRENILFLRAERQADGGRTFRILAGEPLQTSYGEDLYREIFEPDR